MARRFTLHAMVVFGLVGCAPKSELDVEFDMVKVPAEYYRNTKVLAVSKAEGLSPKDQKSIVSRLKDCRVAKEVEAVDRYVHSKQRDIKGLTKDLEEEVGRWTEVKSANAVLAVKVIRDDEKDDIQDVKFVSFGPSNDHEWYPAFGYDYTDRFGFLGIEEFAEKVKAESYKIGLRRNHYDMRIRYVIYNIQSKKIIAMETVAGRARVNLYSQTPTLSPAAIKAALTQSLVDRMMSKLCPAPQKKSQRQLVALKKPKNGDYIVHEGIELAEKNQWEQAADKWRAAATKDKDSPYIANNLGIHAERSGELQEAMRYYQQSEKAKNSVRVPRGYSTEILEAYSFPFTFRDSEPRIYALFGVNQAYIVGGPGEKFQVGTKYPVYRVKHLRYPGSLTDGLEYTEVGVVEVEKVEKGVVPLALVRIKEYIAPMEIEIGDLLFEMPAEKSPQKAAPPKG